MWWEALGETLDSLGNYIPLSMARPWRDLKDGETPQPGDRMTMGGAYMIFEQGAPLGDLFKDKKVAATGMTQAEYDALPPAGQLKVFQLYQELWWRDHVYRKAKKQYDNQSKSEST